MGYESKLYIVQKSSLGGDGDLFWAEKIAEFNLCKMGYNDPFHTAVNQMRVTDCFIYADDGNTMIVKDRYGEKLKEINISPLIRILEKEDQGYRRIKPIIALLRSFGANDWENLIVLHYGY